MAFPNPLQRTVMERLNSGLAPFPVELSPLVVKRVVSHDWGREGKTVLYHRFIAGSLAPEMYRIWADGRVSQH